MSRTLTVNQLIRAGACMEQTNLFVEKFGSSVEVTEDLCESVARDFDWPWAAEVLLSFDGLATFHRIRHQAMRDYFAPAVTLEGIDDYFERRAERQTKLIKTIARAFACLYIAESVTEV